VQELQAKPGVGQRRHDLAERVIPAVFDKPFGGRLAVGVRTLDFEAERLGV
jgi:hypothetical protein